MVSLIVISILIVLSILITVGVFLSIDFLLSKAITNVSHDIILLVSIVLSGVNYFFILKIASVILGMPIKRLNNGDESNTHEGINEEDIDEMLEMIETRFERNPSRQFESASDSKPKPARKNKH